LESRFDAQRALILRRLHLRRGRTGRAAPGRDRNGLAAEKCAKGGLRNAVQSLSITASPNILMVDLSESGDPLNDINALAESANPARW